MAPTRRRRRPSGYNPDSLDAQFATLLAEVKAAHTATGLRFDSQDQALIRIEAQATKTNGRVTALEFWRDTSRAKLAGIALACSAVGAIALELLKILIT